MAVGQALGQLEAGPLAGGHDPLHDPDPFQQHEVAVRRALRQVGVALDDLGDREGEGRLGEDADEPSPGLGVALVVVGEEVADALVEVRRRHPGSVRDEND